VGNYGLGIQSGVFELFTDTVDANFSFGYGSNSGAMTETLRIDNGIAGIVGKEARAVDGTGFKITDDTGINGVHVKDTGDVDISVAGKTTTVKGPLFANEGASVSVNLVTPQVINIPNGTLSVGTGDAQSLLLKTLNLTRLDIDSTGRVGIKSRLKFEEQATPTIENGLFYKCQSCHSFKTSLYGTAHNSVPINLGVMNIPRTLNATLITDPYQEMNTPNTGEINIAPPNLQDGAVFHIRLNGYYTTNSNSDNLQIAIQVQEGPTDVVIHNGETVPFNPTANANRYFELDGTVSFHSGGVSNIVGRIKFADNGNVVKYYDIVSVVPTSNANYTLSHKLFVGWRGDVGTSITITTGFIKLMC
jgi:hypothetical protein